MAVFTYTRKDTVLATLSNGKKLVKNTLTVADTGTDATTVTVNGLQRVITFAFFPRKAGTTPTTFCVVPGALMNQISIDPAADAIGAVLDIIALGV